jgi:hypothetical protein
MKGILRIEQFATRCLPHYYGILETENGEQYSVDHALTEDEAESFNDKDGVIFNTFTDGVYTNGRKYKSGDLSTRFEAKSHIVDEIPYYLDRMSLSSIDEVWSDDEENPVLLWSKNVTQ